MRAAINLAVFKRYPLAAVELGHGDKLIAFPDQLRDGFTGGGDCGLIEVVH
ncbi:hypothetical protein SDC9_207182 [bioreactor metagenome]|uniref:Uncharacterized protein n=1 Tax=bioreactor metagenome TaxID=1076179 RepID=A0A645J772_9ZZZZ